MKKQMRHVTRSGLMAAVGVAAMSFTLLAHAERNEEKPSAVAKERG